MNNKNRTTKSSTLPNLSFIMRKPELMGFEFKNLVDAYSGQMMWSEAMKGKEGKRKTEYTSEFGVTVGCVMRGVKHVEEFAKNTHLLGRGPRLFFGESWFGSVKTAYQVRKLSHHACFAIKMVHSRTPKKFLEETMKDFLGGTWIVMEGRPEKEDVPLVCVGYTYNLNKVLVFLLTKGA